MPDTNLYNEKLLFSQVADGDDRAFRQVFNLYKHKLSVFVFKLTKSESTTSELVQDIFVRLWINRRGLENVDNPGAYLFILARNRTIDHLRKISCEAKLLKRLWEQISKVQNHTEDMLDAKDSLVLINRAVVQLSPQKQKIFRLSRYEGLNHEQIAAHLRLSKSTVKNHMVESLRHIKSYLLRHSETLFLLITFAFARFLK